MTTSLSTNGATQNTTQANLPEVEVQIIWIDSKTAAEWLEKYAGPNRNLSDGQVLRYQSDMENGRWHFTADAIRISDEGKILDGRHRLTALANTIPGMQFPFLVITGLPAESQLYMDHGQVRTVGQQLSLHGVTNSTMYGAVSKLYLDWTSNRLFKSTSRGTTSKPEVIEWVMANEGLLKQVGQTDFQKIDAPTSVTGAFALAVLQIAPVRAFNFLHKLATGAGLLEGDPILALDRRLRNIRRSGVRLTQRDYLAYFIKAWNAWVMGDRLTKLQLSHLTDENFPELLVVSDPAPMTNGG